MITYPNGTFQIWPYAPYNETWDDIWYEICNLDGAMVLAVAYGVNATIFFTCLASLWPQRKQKPVTTYVYLAYICTHFVLSSISFGLNARFNEIMFIDYRNYPGGPNAVFIDFQTYWLNFVPYVLYIMTAWLQDLLLIWRYFIFWDRRWWMLAIPIPLFILSFIVGTMLLIQIGTPGDNVWQSFSVNLFTTFWAAELSTTMFITTLIVARLLYMRHRLRSIMGPNHDSPYLSIAAMLVESGLMYSIGGLTFVISYTINSAFQNMVLNAVGQIQSIAPTLIILRVAQGHGLTRANLNAVSTTIKKSGMGTSQIRMDRETYRTEDTNRTLNVSIGSFPKGGTGTFDEFKGQSVIPMDPMDKI